MFNSKKLKWGLFPLVISPIAIIASCANQSETSLNLESIAKQATFSVEDKLKEDFASKVTINDLKWDQQDQFKDVQIKFENLTSNDGLGQIDFNVKFTKGNETFTLNGKSITNFKVNPAITIDDNKIANDELERITKLNESGQLVNSAIVTKNQIAMWSQNPNAFLTQLEGLKTDNKHYGYNVNSFSIKQNLKSKSQVSFDLGVSFRNGSATKTFEATLNVDDSATQPKPPVSGNLSIIEAREQKRINHKWDLKQTSFSDKEIEELKKTPNLILKQLDQFVYQQYFQYNVSDFSVVNKDKKATISFRINARFWRREGTLNVLKSDLHTYNVNVYEPSDQREEAPKNPTNKTWKIKPVSDPVTFDFSNQNLVNFDVNKLFIKRRSQIDFEPFATKQFLLKLVDENKLFTVTGDLPDDWSWDLYLDYVPLYFRTTNNNNDYQLQLILNYTNSSDLEESEQLTLELNNLTIDESKIEQYDGKKAFNEFKDHFTREIKSKVKLNLESIISGRDGVYQFANLNESNFLNFTNQDWSSLIKPLNNEVRINATDVKINYLTNEIKFKWELIGVGSLNNNKWTDSDESVLKLETNNKDQSGSLNFDDQKTKTWKWDLSNLHWFNINTKMIDRDDLKSKLGKFNKNWTWMAREFGTFLRFTFYQAFNDQFSDITIGFVDKNGQDLPFDQLNQNYSNYKIVLKAKLDFGSTAEQTFLPFVQVFGTALNLTERTYKTGDIITMEVDVESILENPDPVQDATEILPGMGQGLTLGSGLGYQNTIEKWPPRFDIWRAQMGIFNFKISHNNDQLGSIRNIHRFISFNMMSLYNYQDLLWPEPQESGWVSGSFWM